MPILFGSSIYRSMQFAVFDATYTKYREDPFWSKPVGFGPGRWVFLAAVLAGTARATLECPFEYIKVRGQTGASWELWHIYKGFDVCVPRNIGLLAVFFTVLDFYRRKTTFMEHKTGQFFATGVASVASFAAIWPFEFLKNQAQSEQTALGTNIRERLRLIYNTYGVTGIYRGFLPGAGSIFFRNGASMVVMQFLQKELSRRGFRE